MPAFACLVREGHTITSVVCLLDLIDRAREPKGILLRSHC